MKEFYYEKGELIERTIGHPMNISHKILSAPLLQNLVEKNAPLIPQT